ncbi:hypothetical protein ACHQM5_018671 [Ranunculus cassubicifolius]
MVRLSNTLIGLLNTLTLVASITLIAGSLYLRLHGSSECHKLFENVHLILGVALFVISILGVIGACCKVNLFMWFYLFFLSLLMIGLICFTVFAFIVTNHGASKAISGKGYKEYRLGDYSHWLQNHVVNANNWGKFRSCLVDTHICLVSNMETQRAFDHTKLSPLQSGCCKPPMYCGYKYVNLTFWEIPTNGPAAPDTDCTTWSNQQETLCYDCKSCKAGVLETVKGNWKKMAITNLCVLVFIFILQSIAACAYSGNKNDKYKGYKGYY